MAHLSECKNIDCKDYMKLFSDNFFDLAVIDPPYGIGESGGKNKSRGKLWASKEYVDYAGNDKEPPDEEYFQQLLRVSKNQIIFGANHFISKIPYDSSCWLVWDKDNGKTDFADCELAWTSFNTAVRRFKWKWMGFNQQETKPIYREERIHPNQKPVALYSWIYKLYSKPGFKILDTHLGSGSNRIAAWDAKLDFYSCELSKHYFDLQEYRFIDHKKQIKVSDIFPEITK